MPRTFICASGDVCCNQQDFVRRLGTRVERTGRRCWIFLVWTIAANEEAAAIQTAPFAMNGGPPEFHDGSPARNLFTCPTTPTLPLSLRSPCHMKTIPHPKHSSRRPRRNYPRPHHRTPRSRRGERALLTTCARAAPWTALETSAAAGATRRLRRRRPPPSRRRYQYCCCHSCGRRGPRRRLLRLGWGGPAPWQRSFGFGRAHRIP